MAYLRAMEYNLEVEIVRPVSSEEKNFHNLRVDRGQSNPPCPLTVQFSKVKLNKKSEHFLIAKYAKALLIHHSKIIVQIIKFYQISPAAISLMRMPRQILWSTIFKVKLMIKKMKMKLPMCKERVFLAAQ